MGSFKVNHMLLWNPLGFFDLLSLCLCLCLCLSLDVHLSSFTGNYPCFSLCIPHLFAVSLFIFLCLLCLSHPGVGGSH